MYMRNRYGSSEVRQVEITEKDLLEKAREINVANLQPFYNSTIFKAHNFTYDSTRKLIQQKM